MDGSQRSLCAGASVFLSTRPAYGVQVRPKCFLEKCRPRFNLNANARGDISWRFSWF